MASLFQRWFQEERGDNLIGVYIKKETKRETEKNEKLIILFIYFKAEKNICGGKWDFICVCELHAGVKNRKFPF